MHYSPKHAKPVQHSSARRRIVGVGVSGAATIAAGIAAGAPAQASGSVWDRVAACESGGNWSISTGNGFYGGLQFTHSTWIGYGGGRYASNANGASRSEQIAIAQRVLAGQGPGAWPVCSRKAGLTRSNGGASGGGSYTPPATHHTTHHVTHHTTVTHHKAAVRHTVVQHVTRHVVAHKSVSNTHVARVTPISVTDSGKTLTVRSGDCLSKLAATYQIKGGWRAIWSLNQAKVSDPNLIFVGQSLRLPK
jgi:resuscitation-promoting factor RpfA